MMKYLELYKGRGITISNAKDQYAWDKDGNKYLDLHAGYGVAFLGHRNQKVVDYLKKQLDEVMALTTAFDTPIREEMLKELDPLKPDDMPFVFLLNSGTEAVEFSLKIAKKLTKRKKLIAFKNSFHGRTAGSLSVTWNKKYREPFEPLVGPVEFLDYNSLDSLKAVNEEVAAVIVEPVQGEGGVIPADHEFMKAIREITREKGALMIVDEVQTGFGRTGKVWAYQHYGIVPDVVASAKAIGGGFPVSAVFLPNWIAEKLEEGDHGTTYGGNPLAAAAVTAAAKVLKEDSVPEQAATKGDMFIKMLSEELEQYKIVREIRGKGLMIGIDLRVNPGLAIKVIQDEKVLSLKAGLTTIRFLSPYLITKEDMEWALDATRKGIIATESKANSS
ncbi:[LysW]-aminoadipate semialdehyde/glutamate semialdehyde transaminase [Sulfuracidifex metallicus]|uniref:[LysW]-aminoadipate semialdehyde/glutamate semialdehyde transaminase n=1 Tax=Sulfuracidifex metallicus DSM 6482 = JCM 9184 TaxID=523847 RepID=A0A6A9QUF1_SULME|nr:[LysW]-aminoadipate semialdehyde/glutamate semialdehyde transaminase [Sulfuracidifex metallicus]MUN28732.1 acetylornithine/succinylornithine family transaminase [Sulfuracidifex metallicus DSM 6482 = JCM 9184]